MLKTIKEWFKITRLGKTLKIHYLLISAVEVICYIFLPISFANIVTSATQQNTQLTYLWTIINFSTQILTIIATEFKTSLLSNIQKDITNSLSVNSNSCSIQVDFLISNIASFSDSLNSFLMSSLKLVAITISATIYSLYLGIYILSAIIICSTVSILLQTHKTVSIKNSKGYNFSQLKLIENKKGIVDTLWTIFTFIIMLIIIDLINNQKISLSVFLLLTSFINTHLLKPVFSTSILINSKLINNNIVEYKQEINNYGE